MADLKEIKEKAINTLNKVAGIQDQSQLNKENIKKNSEFIKQQIEAQKAEKKKLEFSKKLVIFITVNAELQIWASYILGYLGKTQIAETLSTTVVNTVIYVVICYLVRALIEGLSKHTTMFGQNLPFPNAPSVDSLIESIEEKANINSSEESTTDDTDVG